MVSVVFDNSHGHGRALGIPGKAIAPLFELADRVAHGHAHILIEAEAGNWADRCALRIHEMSPRSKGPFVKISRPDLTEAFIEQVLFGPDSNGQRTARGLFHDAIGGTLYVEEISDYSSAIQGRLLRAIREQATFPTVPAESVRVIAATRLPGEESSIPGNVRRDLWAQLSAVTVRIPPLRERRSEIIEIAHEFTVISAQASGKRVRRISSAAISKIIAYSWPGNLDELRQVIENAVLICDSDAIGLEHLPDELHGPDEDGVNPADGLLETLESLERTLIQEALRHCGGNQAKAATELGITERLMGLRVKKYGLDPKRFRTRR